MIWGILRYFKLYSYFIAFSLGKAFEFRFDFYMRILMDLCYYAVGLAFFKIIFLHTPSLGGWNETQMMVFVSGYLIVDAINMTVFSNNMWFLPMMINKGQLDYYLIRPVSSLFFVTLREFAANSFINLLFALGIFVWAVSQLEPWPGWGKVALFFCLLLNGSLIFFCMNAFANVLVFWTHSPKGFGEIVWNMSKLSERPDRIYKGLTRKILVLVLPYALISSFPARMILDAFDWTVLLHAVAVSIVFLSLLIWVWNIGIKNYSSASS